MHMTISLLLKPIIGLCHLFCHPYIESTIASIFFRFKFFEKSFTNCVETLMLFPMK